VFCARGGSRRGFVPALSPSPVSCCRASPPACLLFCLPGSRYRHSSLCSDAAGVRRSLAARCRIKTGTGGGGGRTAAGAHKGRRRKPRTGREQAQGGRTNRADIGAKRWATRLAAGDGSGRRRHADGSRRAAAAGRNGSSSVSAALGMNVVVGAAALSLRAVKTRRIRSSARSLWPSWRSGILSAGSAATFSGGLVSFSGKDKAGSSARLDLCACLVLERLARAERRQHGGRRESASHNRYACCFLLMPAAYACLLPTIPSMFCFATYIYAFLCAVA